MYCDFGEAGFKKNQISMSNIFVQAVDIAYKTMGKEAIVSMSEGDEQRYDALWDLNDFNKICKSCPM